MAAAANAVNAVNAANAAYDAVKNGAPLAAFSAAARARAAKTTASGQAAEFARLTGRVSAEPWTIGAWSTSHGGATLGATVTCTDCGVNGTADAHVLIRVDEYNPFAEVWSFGDVVAEANVHVTASLTAAWNKSWTREIWPKTCIPYLCHDVTFAGVTGVKLGLVYSLDFTASVDFDAQAELTYKRRVRTRGDVSLHVGSSRSDGWTSSAQGACSGIRTPAHLPTRAAARFTDGCSCIV